MATAKEIFNEIVSDFVSEIKKGKNPFAKLSTPTNGITGRAYSGFNRLALATVAKRRGFDTSKYATFKQVGEAGGKVIKGAKSVPVFMFSFSYKAEIGGKTVTLSANSDAEAKKLAEEKGGRIVDKFPFLKFFLVFNLQETEGLEYKADIKPPLQNAEDLLIACETQIVCESGLPRYDKNRDVLVMPMATTAEEMLLPAIASTAKTLGRELEWAEESLVCLIGASMLAEACGFEQELPADMAEIWLEKLDKNPHFMWKAASEAEKAVELLLQRVVTVRQVAA